MKMQLWLCWFTLLIVAVNAQAADNTFKFTTTVPTDEIQFARSFSEDKHAATLIFENLVAETDIGRGKLPDVVTRRFTFALPIESQQEVCVTQDIRGFINTVGSGSTALLVQSGGVTTLIDLKKAVKEAEGKAAKTETATHKLAAKAAKDQGFSGKKAPTGSHDFYHRVEARVPAGKPLQVTLVLLTERLPGDDGSGALMIIDSLDFEIHPIPAK